MDGASAHGYALGNLLRYTDPTGEFVPLAMAAAAFAGRPYLWGALSDWLFDDGCYTFDEYLRDLATDLALGPLGKAVAGKIIGALGRAAGNIPPGAMHMAANGTDNVATGAAARAAGAIRRFAADESGSVTVPSFRNLLAAPKMHKHHIFPQQFRSTFKQLGIDIDAHTVAVPEFRHLNQIHGGGGYNERWAKFLDAGGDSITMKDVYQFGGQMMNDYGLNNLPIIPYR